MATSWLLQSEVVSNRFAVLATYRHLLRATGIAFRGDRETLRASRKLAHDQFFANRKLLSGDVDTAQAIEHAQAVAQILRENVVQGENSGGDSYKLNIHEHTQRLDNATAKELQGTSKSFKEIRDAQF